MGIRGLAARAGRYAFWRGYAPWAYPLADRLAARRGFLARLVRWPLPWMAPWRMRQLDVVRHSALGDVLMCTPALREVKRLNPGCRITFYTDYPEVVEGLPFIDRVRPGDERPAGYHWLSYEKSIPLRRHAARVIGDRIGVAVRDVRPSCAVRPELVERYRRDWEGRPRPLVLVNRRAGPFTPNKDWPDESWDDLVARLTARGTVVEVGGPTEGPSAVPRGSYLDLRGRTSRAELVAAIAAADVLVTPESGPMHVAAAVGTPAVVIFGGYIDPVATGYEGNINLYSAVECAPCWLSTPCPVGRKCLHQITPGQVEAAVDRIRAGVRRAAPAVEACDAAAG